MTFVFTDSFNFGGTDLNFNTPLNTAGADFNVAFSGTSTPQIDIPIVEPSLPDLGDPFVYLPDPETPIIDIPEAPAPVPELDPSGQFRFDPIEKDEPNKGTPELDLESRLVRDPETGTDETLLETGLAPSQDNNQFPQGIFYSGNMNNLNVSFESGTSMRLNLNRQNAGDAATGGLGQFTITHPFFSGNNENGSFLVGAQAALGTQADASRQVQVMDVPTIVSSSIMDANLTAFMRGNTQVLGDTNVAAQLLFNSQAIVPMNGNPIAQEIFTQSRELVSLMARLENDGFYAGGELNHLLGEGMTWGALEAGFANGDLGVGVRLGFNPDGTERLEFQLGVNLNGSNITNPNAPLDPNMQGPIRPDHNLVITGSPDDGGSVRANVLFKF